MVAVDLSRVEMSRIIDALHAQHREALRRAGLKHRGSINRDYNNTEAAKWHMVIDKVMAVYKQTPPVDERTEYDFYIVDGRRVETNYIPVTEPTVSGNVEQP